METSKMEHTALRGEIEKLYKSGNGYFTEIQRLK